MKHRIAMISEHASPVSPLGGIDSGGQNVYVGQLALHLAAAGYEVDVFTRRDNTTQPEVLQWRDRVRVVHVPAGPACFVAKEDMLPYMGDFRAFMEARWSQLGGYSLIHANFWMSGLVAAELKRRLRVPFVITFHALGKVRRRHLNEADGFPDERFEIEERLVREADSIIAECPQDRLDLVELYGADPGCIAIVPCGFSLDELSPVPREDARRVIDIPPEQPMVLQLGRLVPRKGIDTLVRALGMLRRQHELEPRLLVVGGDSDQPDPGKTPEIGRLNAIARDEGVDDLVTFTGRRDRDCIRYFYSAADVFVTTPAYEPFGMTPLEAMACARPVIGAKVGGIKYTVEHGKTGFLVPPGDAGALAERLAFLLRNPEVAERMGRAGLERARARFTWTGVTKLTASVYESVLSQPAPTRPAFRAGEHEVIDGGFNDAVEVLRTSRLVLKPPLIEAARNISSSISAGGKILLCGNGGSAADAQHFAAELVGHFQVDRQAFPAIALTSDGTILTAWANDACFDDVFARQVQALGRHGDVLIAISTSGRSPNVLRAVAAAHSQDMTAIAITGHDGGPLAREADVSIVVPSADTQRIQEVHGLVVHLLCHLVENALCTRLVPPLGPLAGAENTVPTARRGSNGHVNGRA
jgi:phosphoheptose isomerase